MDSDDEASIVEPCCDADIAKSCRKIFKKLLYCLLVFYCFYYCFATFFHGLFDTKEKFGGNEPFNFSAMSSLNFLSGQTKSLVSFLTLEMTYFCTTISMALYLRERVWDYAITTTILHILLSSAVMKTFPTNWQWWVSISIGLLWMVVMGECISYFWRQFVQKRKNQAIQRRIDMKILS